MKAATPVAVILVWLVLASPAAAQQWADRYEATHAPDVGGVAAGWTADGSLGVALSFFTRIWTAGDRLDLYVDADGNTATGDRGGAEYGVFYEQYGTGSATLYGAWNGSGFTIIPAGLRPVVQTGGWAILLPPGLIGNAAGPVNFRVSTRALPWPSSFDFAPDTGAYIVAARTALGGAAGSGAPAPASAPTAGAPLPVPSVEFEPSAPALTFGVARRAIRKAFRRRGAALRRMRCRRVSDVRRRCTVTGTRRGWRLHGTATATSTSKGVRVTVRGTQRRAGTRRRFTWR